MTHSQDQRAGFTLIELLVVIGILSLLIVAFTPGLFTAQQSADKIADKANLNWHWQQIVAYNTQHRTVPRGTGHRFVFDPWIRGVCQRTQENFDRYWVPGMPDPRKEELQDIARQDPKNYEALWRSADDVSSLDTHYAGPGPELKRQRLYGDGKLPVMANDNEFAPLFTDNTIHVLMGAGAIRELKIDPDFLEFGFTGDEDGAKMEVGPQSPHPLLQLLEH